MKQNIFLRKFLKIIWYLYQIKNTLNILVALVELGLDDQMIDDMTLTTQSGGEFVLRLHYNGSKSFLFVNATKVCQLKAKNSGIKDYALCLVNISKNLAINNLKKRIKMSCKFFSVDFNLTDSKRILNIHKYFMKRT